MNVRRPVAGSMWRNDKVLLPCIVIGHTVDTFTAKTTLPLPPGTQFEYGVMTIRIAFKF